MMCKRCNEIFEESQAYIVDDYELRKFYQSPDKINAELAYRIFHGLQENDSICPSCRRILKLYKAAEIILRACEEFSLTPLSQWGETEEEYLAVIMELESKTSMYRAKRELLNALKLIREGCPEVTFTIDEAAFDFVWKQEKNVES